MRKYYDLLCSILWMLLGCFTYVHYWYNPENLGLTLVVSIFSGVFAIMFFLSYLGGLE